MRTLWVVLIALCFISSATSQDAESAKTTELRGEVSVGGKLLEKGRILFYSEDGQIVGCTVREGKYKIEKPNIGALYVTIDGPNVAEKYSDPETSGVICEIKQDVKNRMDFNLQPSKTAEAGRLR